MFSLSAFPFLRNSSSNLSPGRVMGGVTAETISFPTLLVVRIFVGIMI